MCVVPFAIAELGQKCLEAAPTFTVLSVWIIKIFQRYASKHLWPYKRRKNVKNQDGGLKVPLFDLKPSECHVRCQTLIGTYASTHSTFNLISPCNKHQNIQSHKATKIHTLKPCTVIWVFFFQNSSIIYDCTGNYPVILKLSISIWQKNH